MKTLLELLNAYKPFGMSDMEIIQNYFTENNLESAALELIPILAKSQTEKLQRKLDYAQSWVPTLDYPFGVTDKVAQKALMRIAAYFMVSRDLPDDLAEWARKNIPTMNIPKIYFIPAAEWLGTKYGIYFKEYNNGQR